MVIGKWLNKLQGSYKQQSMVSLLFKFYKVDTFCSVKYEISEIKTKKKFCTK